MKYIFSFFAFILTFLILGCVSFSNPLVSYSEAKYDRELLGLWAEVDSEQESDDYVLVLGNSEGKKYKITSFSRPKYSFENNEMENEKTLVYSGEFDNEKYLFFYFYDDEKYFFANYKIIDDCLIFYTLNADVLENAIQNKKLSGSVMSGKIVKESFVSASQNELQDFFRKRINDLYDKNSVVKYKRVKEFK